MMRFTLLIVLAVTLSACTPKASFQQGVFAGQSSERIDAIVVKQDSRTEFWQNRAITFERADAIEKAAQKKALALTMRDPARAANAAWDIAIEFSQQMEAIDAVDAAERRARADDVAYGLELAKTPVDVAEMSRRQNEARSRFARETASMALTTGTQIFAQYQQFTTRRDQEREAARQAEKLRAEMAEREAKLAEREAHMQHQEPAQPVQPVIVPPATTNPTTPGE
jgi:hypothetical protein